MAAEIMLPFIDTKTVIEHQHIGGGKSHCPSEKKLNSFREKKSSLKRKSKRGCFSQAQTIQR